MILHTVVVSYERLDLLKRTLESYQKTVTLPHTLVVVDNGSSENVLEFLTEYEHVDQVIFLAENKYPGYAVNHGFALAPPEATLLHRSDNDMEYLPGWCDEVVERFQDPNLWQLGLRTLEEEGAHGNVGGNCILRREAWESGIRYSEAPWTEVPFEDTQVSQRVYRAGKLWGRVQKPCTVHIGIASCHDPYYQKTFAERRITFAQYGITT